MKGSDTFILSANQKLYWSAFNRPGKATQVHVSVGALYDRRCGEYAIQATIPDGHRIVLPDDLGTLMQCFGWAVAGLDLEMRIDRDKRPDHRIWKGCCDTIWSVEAKLKLDVPRDGD